MPNRYAVLAQEKDHGHSLAYEAATDCQECTQSASICTGGKVVPRLADDGLGDLFELSTEFKVWWHLMCFVAYTDTLGH